MKRIAIILLLSGCATVPQQLDTVRYSAEISGRTHCYLKATIAWVPQHEVERLCGYRSLGCVKGSYAIMRKPESWNDWSGLRTLGHEVLHLCGEQHEAVK